MYSSLEVRHFFTLFCRCPVCVQHVTKIVLQLHCDLRFGVLYNGIILCLNYFIFSVNFFQS